jgi:hypothetical protein
MLIDAQTAALLKSNGIDPAAVVRAQRYTYCIDWATVIAAANRTESVRIDMGSAFLCQRVSFSAWTGARNTPVGRLVDRSDTTSNAPAIDGILLDISDSTGRWSNVPIRAANFAGRVDSEPLDAPALYTGGAQIFCNLANTHTTAGLDVAAQLAFKGVRLYLRG